MTPRLDMVVAVTHPDDVQRTSGCTRLSASPRLGIEPAAVPRGRTKTHVLARSSATGGTVLRGAVKESPANREESRFRPRSRSGCVLKVIAPPLKNNFSSQQPAQLQEPRARRRVASCSREPNPCARCPVHRTCIGRALRSRADGAQVSYLCDSAGAPYAHDGSRRAPGQPTTCSRHLSLDLLRLISKLVSTPHTRPSGSSGLSTSTSRRSLAPPCAHISDDGVARRRARPRHFDPPPAAGEDLAAQLHGTLAVSRAPRTTFTITFGPDGRERRAP